jgi:hypothetical protein
VRVERLLKLQHRNFDRIRPAVCRAGAAVEAGAA